MKDEKKNGKEKVVEEKGHGEKAAIQKLMNETMRKLSVLAKDIVTVPRKNTTGWKFGSKLLIAMGARKSSFYMWVYEYSEKTGARLSIDPFQIKSTGKASEDVIAGLIKQVKKNYDILTAVNKPKKTKKTEAKKESFKNAKIVKEVPIKEALKEEASPTTA